MVTDHSLLIKKEIYSDRRNQFGVAIWQVMARCVKGMHLEIGWQLKPLCYHCAILLPLMLTLLPLCVYHCAFLSQLIPLCTTVYFVPLCHLITVKLTLNTFATAVETTNDAEASYHASLLRLETINQGGNCCTFARFVKCIDLAFVKVSSCWTKYFMIPMSIWLYP